MIKFDVNSFFDRKAVADAVPPAKRRALTRIGAFLRRTMRRQIRNRKRSANDGQPPTNRTGLLKDHVYFSFDAQAEDVVIGPAAIPSAWSDPSTPVPGLLEHGGSVRRRRRRRGGKMVTETANYAAFPFAKPALDRELQNGKLAEAWKNSVVA